MRIGIRTNVFWVIPQMWESTNKGRAKTEQTNQELLSQGLISPHHQSAAIAFWCFECFSYFINEFRKWSKRLNAFQALQDGRFWMARAMTTLQGIFSNIYLSFIISKGLLEDSRHIVCFVEKNENLKHNCCFCRKDMYSEAGLFPGFVTFQLKEHFGNHTFSVVQSLIILIRAVLLWYFSLKPIATFQIELRHRYRTNS